MLNPLHAVVAFFSSWRQARSSGVNAGGSRASVDEGLEGSEIVARVEVSCCHVSVALADTRNHGAVEGST